MNRILFIFLITRANLGDDCGRGGADGARVNLFEEHNKIEKSVAIIDALRHLFEKVTIHVCRIELFPKRRIQRKKMSVAKNVMMAY
mgnify:CR=1 FL=1